MLFLNIFLKEGKLVLWKKKKKKKVKSDKKQAEKKQMESRDFI